MLHINSEQISALRSQIARLETASFANRLSSHEGFGIGEIDDRLPGNGLGNALHEVVGVGPETEHGAAAALFLAGILARREGPVLWTQERADLFAPGLAAAGLPPERIVYLDAGKAVLAAMEDGLHTPGLAGVVGETSARIMLTASRRLQLAAEASGVPAFLLRRSRSFDDPRLAEPNAAVTRWRIAALPSSPPVPSDTSVLGLARAVWRLDLVRCRGGEPASWIMEACDATGRLRLVSDISDRPFATDWRAAAG